MFAKGDRELIWSWIDCDYLNHNDSIHNFNFQSDSPKQLIFSSFYLGFNSIRTVQQTNRRPAKDVAFMNRAIQRRQLKMSQTKNRLFNSRSRW